LNYTLAERDQLPEGGEDFLLRITIDQ
jgi:hypothetical protein